jgi:DNA processing protein
MTGAAPAAFACLLAGLPGMGPRRLTALLDHFEPAEAWAHATGGPTSPLRRAMEPAGPISDEVVRAWRVAGAHADPSAVLAQHRAAGVRVLLRDDPAYPPVLRDDLEPSAVLFVQGDLGALEVPRAAIVGTRRCTRAGAEVARDLGRELAGAGVAIVSGLALGIDGAAHRGVLAARAEHPEAPAPIGVVGSGLDVVYPARHRDLWAAVAQQGLLLSEAPLGARPAAWRFPARNRIIAALADVVVVVESHAAGGSLHTVTEAIVRDRPVLAVPGSVRSPAAAGTNQLLADGCHPARDADDVLVALGLTTAARRRRPRDRRPTPDATSARVLDAFDWEPATFEHLAVRTGLSLADLAVALETLTAAGWVGAEGGWYERVAAP